jgi:tellurite resistance protein TerA
MCFNSPKAPPPPPPLIPAPPAPPKPDAPAPAPAPLQPAGAEPTLKTKQSKREQQGSLSKGASQLKIGLNTGTSGGGLNL